ncbi:DNA repair protein RadA [candidate division WOR-3 bacterium JGI_Cruoil_03_44_89]|uniref:DNA repair protein RadA n=1 Tax=candidate division WOR-3 bacterium JGI_Cruoil_03_44_89 TaxID=1973748 RepID=A0A235BN60_UNCW3|nr:MAG: DNA repair protein RadA [candidate division WOR-3 bacterium JGI_Cruoil_03_44_89]
MKANFVCNECGYSSPKWMGRCPSCGAWNTFKEVKPLKKDAHIFERRPPMSIREIKSSTGERLKTNIAEFDRVLGGGIVKGSLVLLGGEPGIGKSTLILQAAKNLAREGVKILYISGEESPHQIKLRAERMGIDEERILVLSETDIEMIEEEANEIVPGLLIIDSIQTMYCSSVQSSSGSIAQVKGCTQELLKLAKNGDMSVLIVGHVTKGGAIAGPKTLEHIVDTVLYLEGDRNHYFRILRAAKNRFGSTNEIGVFEMEERGLKEIKDPSMVFLMGRNESAPGTSVSCVLEGTRAFLVEIQALTSPTYYGYPQRVSSSIDSRRLSMLLAVVEKRLGLRVSNQDVFLNIVGGLRIEERACDLAILASIVSSLKGFRIPKKLLIIGEVGLSGEVRAVPRTEKRIKEAEKLGFEIAIIPKSSAKLTTSINVKQLNWAADAIEYIKGKRGQRGGTFDHNS